MNLSREPEIVPRVGEKFQAEIPQLISRAEFVGFSESSVGASVPASLPYSDHRKGRKAKASNRSRKLSSLVLSEPASWTEMEKQSFLVGLYIFRKNFAQLAEFIETKSTGDIMAYYYGRFFHSQEHSSWTDKTRRRKRCIHGHKIFRGARQQELLARLFNNVSEGCKTELIEVSREYSEGRIALQEYISSLKRMVGLKLLVEAVGVGKGRQDLTGVTFEPSRPEIPTGKAFTNLSVSQIVEYLTGDYYRKSKIKLDDLFFEAVRPRLLERGWTSEQPKDPCYPLSVQMKPYVFLVPGDNSVSRRRLSKGVHFYDSINDVLSIVSKDPRLIDDIRKTSENDIMLEEDEAPTRSRQYLQPRTTTCVTSPGMRLTIVDASSDGERAHMVKELKIPQEFNKPNPGKLKLITEHKPQPVNESLMTYILELKQQKKAASKRVPDMKDRCLVNKRSRKMAISNQVETSNFSDNSEENVPTQASPSLLNADDERSSLSSQNQAMKMDDENDILMQNAEKSKDEIVVDQRSQQRRGTRNRPPTSRALEAIASGFL